MILYTHYKRVAPSSTITDDVTKVGHVILNINI